MCGTPLAMKQSGFEIESLNTRMTKSPMPLLMLALIWQETEDAHVFSNACSLYYVRTPRMKQSETAAVGCFVGLCALISPFCDFAKAPVSNLQALCNNGRRGEERGREGASRRGEQKSMRHRVETRRGSFVRRFRLPENAKLEKIDSGLDHGVLTLTKTNVQETPRNVRHIDVA